MGPRADVMNMIYFHTKNWNFLMKIKDAHSVVNAVGILILPQTPALNSLPYTLYAVSES